MNNLVHHLRDRSTIRVARKGTNVLFQGEIPRKGMLVREGVIRAYIIMSSGEERIVSLYGKDDIFPLSWMLNETANSLFYYEALTDARLMSIGKDDFNSVLREKPEIMSSLLKSMANENTALLLRITGLEQSRAVEKIAYTLYYLLFRYGIEKKKGTFTIDVKLSQLMIANLVGVARESTTKNLKVLQKKGIISYSSSTYTVDKAKLESFIGEDSFRDITL